MYVYSERTRPHPVGWMALYAGIGGGADVILLPEMPFDIEKVVATIRERDASSRRFTIVVTAEGSRPANGNGKFRHHNGRRRHGGIAAWLADALSVRVNHDVRPLQLGHTQRGGQPRARDRRIATTMGAKAVELAAADKQNRMVSMIARQLSDVPLSTAGNGVRRVTPANPTVVAARATGISFGV